MTYQKPAAPLSTTLEVFTNVQSDTELDYWQPYRTPGDSTQVESPSHAIQTAKEMAKLSQIIHECINVYCGSRGKVSAKNIIALYGRFLEWKDSLSEDLSITAANVEFLPHVLCLQYVARLAFF